jgi:diaminobutyrate-2-oxoglutarate transaminase
MINTSIFETLESEVRSYCRTFDTVFTKATGSTMIDEEGREYIDFFAGAGSLNYGHNPPALKQKLIEYLSDDNIVHSLDMYTTAKRDFLEACNEIMLKPRGLDYKIMFTGPTGTNAVEAALKTARLVTGRTNVIAFTNAFHGMTLGSLAVTGNSGKRDAAGVTLGDVSRVPFHRYLGDVDTIDILAQYLDDHSSGFDAPAALVLETVQAEGGVNVATNPWLRRLKSLLEKHGILMILDDIQVGCGRTGKFFSFEDAGIKPDIVCLSKSLSGYGLPFAVTMMKPELDLWEPGKHNGTFRGHNLAMITATEALKTFWQTNELTQSVLAKGKIIRETLSELAQLSQGEVRGRGMIQGVEFVDTELAGRISQAAFHKGLIIETAGPRDEVLKVLPPLTIAETELRRGLDLLVQTATKVIGIEASTGG